MKNWCHHITRAGDDKGWIMYVDSVNPMVIPIPRHWKVCPICQAERPTAAAIKAAKLRHAMDNTTS